MSEIKSLADYQTNKFGNFNPQQSKIGAPPVNYGTPNMQAPSGGYNSLAATMGPEFESNFGIDQPGGFDFSDAMGNFSMGAQGVMGLANAYNAWQQTGLMKDQLGFQKNMANRNIANSAATTNRMLDDRSSMAAQMTSGADYGTPEYLAAKGKLQTTVDGSPVA